MNDQIIRTPGKFEGEPEYVRVLWEEYVFNWAEDTIEYDGERVCSVFFARKVREVDYPDVFDVTFKDNAHAHAIILWEDEQGFVNSAFPTREEYDAWIADINA